MSTTSATAHFNWPNKGASSGFIVAVQAHFLAQGRRIQGPAVDEGRLGAEAAKSGQVAARLLKRGLIVAPWNCFAEKTCALQDRGPARGRGGIHIQDGGRPALRARRADRSSAAVASLDAPSARISKSAGGGLENKLGIAASVCAFSSW